MTAQIKFLHGTLLGFYVGCMVALLLFNGLVASLRFAPVLGLVILAVNVIQGGAKQDGDS